MELVFVKIFLPNKHSFKSRRIQLCNQSAKIHSHNNFELNLITSGSGRRIIGDNISKFEKGDLVLLAPHVPHCWEIIDPEKDKEPSSIVTHFDENIINSDFLNIPELEKVKNLLNQANRGISFRIKEKKKISMIFEEMLNLKGLECYIALLKIFNFLLKIEDFEYLSNPINNVSTFSKNLTKINKIYEYVFLNIQEGIKLNAAARVLNMAPSSFCRYFKKKTNSTFIEYVSVVRVGIATKMLAESDEQITKIGYDSGYNSMANFNHSFKKIMRQTPSGYRKNFRKKEQIKNV